MIEASRSGAPLYPGRMKAPEAPSAGIRREIEPTPGAIAIASPAKELRTGVRLEARRPGRSRAVMDPFKVKDGILENISLSVKKVGGTDS